MPNAPFNPRPPLTPFVIIRTRLNLIALLGWTGAALGVAHLVARVLFQQPLDTGPLAVQVASLAASSATVLFAGPLWSTERIHANLLQTRNDVTDSSD
ncbi:hypothetical protein [Dolichospermum phage Dfl-JY45]